MSLERIILGQLQDKPPSKYCKNKANQSCIEKHHRIRNIEEVNRPRENLMWWDIMANYLIGRGWVNWFNEGEQMTTNPRIHEDKILLQTSIPQEDHSKKLQASNIYRVSRKSAHPEGKKISPPRQKIYCMGVDIRGFSNQERMC